MGWRIASFVMLLVLFALAVLIVVAICSLPGKAARDRNHPQAKAIDVSAWLGLVTGMITWVLALVWAYTVPAGKE
ncbi:MAG: DUF3302 domain-containing protein [Planctomycetota bacterium]|jgi:hypothetical protein